MGQKPRLQRAAHAGATLRMWQPQCLERRPEHAPSSACPRAPAPVPLAQDRTPREPQAPRSHSLTLTALESLLCPGGQEFEAEHSAPSGSWAPQRWRALVGPRQCRSRGWGELSAQLTSTRGNVTRSSCSSSGVAEGMG